MEGGSPACALAAAKAHRCPGEGVARPLEAVIDTASQREPKLVYLRGAPAAPVSGQRELHGLVAAATLLGPPLQPQLPPLCPAPDVPAALNCFSPCLCWRWPACLVCLPGLPSTALSPTDFTSPLRLRLIILALWAPPLPVYTSVAALGFAHGFVYPCVSFLKVGAVSYPAKHSVSQ